MTLTLRTPAPLAVEGRPSVWKSAAHLLALPSPVAVTSPQSGASVTASGWVTLPPSPFAGQLSSHLPWSASGDADPPNLGATRGHGSPFGVNIWPPSSITGQQLREVGVPLSLLPESVTLSRSPSFRDFPGSVSGDAHPPNLCATRGHGSPFGLAIRSPSDIGRRHDWPVQVAASLLHRRF